MGRRQGGPGLSEPRGEGEGERQRDRMAEVNRGALGEPAQTVRGIGRGPHLWPPVRRLWKDKSGEAKASASCQKQPPHFI